MTNVELRLDYKPKGDTHRSTTSSKLYNVYFKLILSILDKIGHF